MHHFPFLLATGDSYEDMQPPAELARSQFYEDIVHKRPKIAPPMVASKPSSIPPSSSCQQPSSPSRKQPPPVLPKPSLAGAKSSSPGGSPVLAHRAHTGEQNAKSTQPDVMQLGGAVAQPGSPLARKSFSAQGQTSPVPIPRQNVQKPSPLPKPRHLKSDATAYQQVS